MSNKLPVVKASELIKFLETKGFVLVTRKSKGSHRVLRNSLGRRTVVSTHGGNNEIGKGLLETILAQAGIEIEEFKQYWYGKRGG